MKWALSKKVMSIPIVSVVSAATTLAMAVRDYLISRQATAAEGKRHDLAKEVIDLQSDLRKQADFIAKLTEEVETLAAQVNRQHKSLLRWQIFTGCASAIAAVSIALLFFKV